MKNRLLTCFLFCVIMLTGTANQITACAESGKCGEVEWSITDKTLYITGNGKMKNYDSWAYTPWASHRGNIRMIVISEGVTVIGKNNFNNLTLLRKVSLPSTITQICDGAFYMTNDLTDVFYDGDRMQWEGITIGIKNDSYLNKATIHFTKEEEGYTQNNVTTLVEGVSVIVQLYNVSLPCKIIVCGYKGGVLQNFESVLCNQLEESIRLRGEFDTVKVLVWDNEIYLKPSCNPVTIPSKEWC